MDAEREAVAAPKAKGTTLSWSREQVFSGDSELARRMRELDWSRTDLGPPETWPDTWRTAVNLCLTSGIPIVLYLGPSFTVLYNDVYISFLGEAKHPRYLGQPGRECWREIWDTIGPMLESVYATGKATWSEDVLMFFARRLPLEEVYVRFTFGPIPSGREGLSDLGGPSRFSVALLDGKTLLVTGGAILFLTRRHPANAAADEADCLKGFERKLEERKLLTRERMDALRRRLIGARDLIIDSAPILAWCRTDPDAAVGHAPAQHPRPLLRGYRVHTLLCRGSGLPIFYLLSPANVHDAPFARPLLEWAVRLYAIRPRIIRLDAAYWGLRLIAWIHAVLGAIAVIPWNPKSQKNRSCLPPTWTKQELGKRSGIERFFGRLFRVFPLQRPPLTGWSTVTCAVALSFSATIIVALAASQAGRPDLIRSPTRVLAHLWEGVS